MKCTLALVLLVLGAVPALAGPAPTYASEQDVRLKAFLDAAYDGRIGFSPERMTLLGIKRDYGRLDDYTAAGSQRELQLLRQQKAELEREFNVSNLGPQAQLSYLLFKGDVERFEQAARWRGHRFMFSALDMPTSNIPLFLINNHRVENAADAEAYVSRLREVERVMTEISADLTARAANGVLEPALIFGPAIAGARQVIAGSPFAAGPDTPLWADFKAKLSKLDIDGATRDRLLADGEAALRGPFRRGYEHMIATLESAAKRATSNEGVWRLPDGAAYYASKVALSTTTALTPDQVHQIGLREMARIQDEMRESMRKLDFKGSLQEFFAHIKTAPEFHYPNSEAGRAQYLADARAVVAEAMSKAPAKFHRLPKAQLEVRAVEKWREATAPIAFYNVGAPDGSRPGVVYINFADLSQTLKPQLTSIACHEGAPGHHFQFSLASELEGLPTFRRRGNYFAYGEGWGMYAESFCEELGLYKDPYSKLGQLAGDALRAARLVADTGVNAKRWTREQAATYLKQNTLLSDLDAAREVDRYLSVPGQATSYKIGHLKIIELRRRAEAELGARFDIRDFHEVVLTNGAVPLDVLERLVDAYIAAPPPPMWSTAEGQRYVPAPARKPGEGAGPFRKLVIRGVTMIDGTGGPPRGPVDITIEGNRIENIRSAGTPGVRMKPDREPRDFDHEIDATGMYLLPGFVDTHGHGAELSKAPDLSYAYKLWLAHGVTTVRGVPLADVTTTLSEKRRSEKNEIAAPRIFAYGRIGEGWNGGRLDTPAKAREFVRWAAATGLDGIKFFNRGDETPEIDRAAIDEARKLKLGTVAHLSQNNVASFNADDAGAAGLGTVTHFYGHFESLLKDVTIQPFPADYNNDDESMRFGEVASIREHIYGPDTPQWRAYLQHQLERGVTFDPTFVIYSASRDLMKARTAEWLPTYTLPRLMRFFEANREYHGSYFYDWTSERELAWKKYYELYGRLMNDYKNLGGRVTVGTDAGYIWKLWGFSFVEEMEIFREAGFTPLEILRAATSEGAASIYAPKGQPAPFGMVRRGMLADLIIVPENPLANLKVLYGTRHLRLNPVTNESERVGGVRYTIKDGVVYDAPALLDDVAAMVEAEKRELAQTSDATPAAVPKDAQHFVISSLAGKHGDSWRWAAPDGTRQNRETMSMRGLSWEWSFEGQPGNGGLPAMLEVRGTTPSGSINETFAVASGHARWRSSVDEGSAPFDGRFYSAHAGPIETTAWLVEQLIATASKQIDLLPSGTARMEHIGSLVVGEGAARQAIDLWTLTGVTATPQLIWTDQKRRFFSLTAYGYLTWLPEVYAGEFAKMQAFSAAAAQKKSSELARTLARKPKAPVAFTHVRMFDADGVRFLEDQTVVVNDGLISAVGPAAAATIPPRTEIIDGRGMTLSPGLWDAHKHVGDDYSGIQCLAFGITSIRDPGNDDSKSMDRRARRATGELLFPHMYLSSMIDGKGPYTAQVANVATSEAEAIAHVRRAKANDFSAVKIYGSFDAAWLPATIAEAHRLGLHVHGHLPAGLRPLDVIKAGYDEITHINWLIMQGMPEDVVKQSNSIMRVEGPGRYGKDVDLDSPAMKELITTMAAKQIYADPTMVVFEGLLATEQGEIAAAAIPYVGTMPIAVERTLRSGGLKPPAGYTRADFRASWAKMIELLGHLHRTGVSVVAGTDATGFELVRELEIYQQAGFTPAEALAAATLIPARLVGQDRRTGSIKVGKVADLVLVEGDPSRYLGDMRNTRIVMLDGLVLDADALRTTAGFSGRPNNRNQSTRESPGAGDRLH